MKREIKNDGVYLECNFDDIFSKADEIENAKVVVFKKGRIEFAGAEKESFIKAINAVIDEQHADLDDKQKADLALRSLLLPDGT